MTIAWFAVDRRLTAEVMRPDIALTEGLTKGILRTHWRHSRRPSKQGPIPSSST